MRIFPMYANAPETHDLVHHTAKHFLDADESEDWDLVPGGTLSAREARGLATRDGVRPPPYKPAVDVRWWYPPWRALALDAHDRGYRPRYELLLHLAPDPDSARWEDTSRSRRMTEYVGARLVLEPRGPDWQVVTAFFSPTCRGYDRLPHLAPALRAFAARKARKHCPLPAPSRVSEGEDTP